MTARLRAAIAGVGFIGPVHLRAARRAGAEVVGIAGRDRARTEQVAASLGVPRVFEDAAELARDPEVDIVHICTPNAEHAEPARIAIAAGKHVVCEKPLATSVEDAAELVARAAAAGVVAAVPFVYRFHPVVREARARIADGRAGAVRLIHGSYLQDWLALPDDGNWRVDPARGGPSRAFADIGQHWCDVVEFVTGHRIARLSARTRAVYPARVSEDAVTMQLETAEGAVGTLVVSQVSPGRKNRLWFEIDAAHESLVFDQEQPDQLWLGARACQTTVVRDPATLSPAAARYAILPAGHAQGYGDAFDAFVADAYAAIGGAAPDGLPTFTDGLRAARITEAVLASSHTGRWEEVSP